MIHITWSEFKNQLVLRKSTINYFDKLTYYRLVMNDGNFSAFTIIQKTSPANSDQTDFETNYKSLITNNKQVIQQVALTLAEDNLNIGIQAFSFTAPKNTTSSHDYLLNNSYLFRGIVYLSSDINLGDYVTIQLIDIDNVLGNGVNYILGTPVSKAYMQSTTNSGPISMQDISAVELPAAGLYMRVNYTNTNVINTVTVYINMDLYTRT